MKWILSSLLALIFGIGGLPQMEIPAGEKKTSQAVQAEVKTYISQYHLLSGDLAKRSNAEIKAFLERYPKAALAEQLRGQWLVFLASKKRWQDFLTFYQTTANSTLRCQQALALFHTKQTALAFKQAKQLWLVSYSQPKVCDQLFSLWKKKQGLSDELIWQRFTLAMNRKNYQLSKYLLKSLPAEKQALAKLFLKVHRNPNNLTKINFKETPLAKGVILHGLFRLSLKHPQKAIKLWEKLQKQYQFNAKQQANVRGAIALGLATSKHPDAEKWLSTITKKYSAPTLRAWRVRTALRERNWPKVKMIIEQLPDNEHAQPVWQYWYARALEHMGFAGQANDIYQYLATQRHYYGMLACKRLKKAFPLNHQQIPLTADNITEIENIAAIQRAYYFYRNKHYTLARKEWQYALNQLQPQQIYIAAKIAEKWGWHSQAIFTAKRAHHRDDLVLRFPLAHQKLVTTAAEKYKLPPEFIYAIMRQESAFMHDAKSHAGALGVMQLMPRTAKEIAKEIKFPLKNKLQLLNVKTNINLGSAHLKKVHQQFNGRFILAAAAYNAGSSQVLRWLPKNKTIEPEIWIETIPWYETRNYLKNVMTYLLIYQERLKKT